MIGAIEGLRVVRVAAEDDVAVALAPIAAGERVRVDGAEVVVRDAIPAGHKFALRAVAAGAPVHRYRAPIGLATRDIAIGEHVHSHNVRTGLSGELDYRFTAPATRRLSDTYSGRSFRG